MDIPLPRDLELHLQQLVAAGEYPDVHTAAVDLIRRGLARARGRPPVPPPPVRPEPYPDKPIESHPWDVNWAP